MAHIRQSRPDSSLDFEVKVRGGFHVVPSSLGRGAVVTSVLHQLQTLSHQLKLMGSVETDGFTSVETDGFHIS